MAHRMPKQPAISVALTVLDNEAAVARAVESVLNQSFGDIELVCVCAPAADAARRTCERFAERDIRVEVRSCDGTSAAALRNAALAELRGSYATFCDGNDWLAPGALAALAQAVQCGAVDMAIGGVYVDAYRGRDQERRSRAVVPAARSTLVEGAMRDHAANLLRDDLLVQLGGKLFSVRRLRELEASFEDASRSEALFVLQYLRRASTVYLCADPVYHRTVPGAAVPATYRPDLFDRCSLEYDELLGLWTQWGFEEGDDGLNLVHHRYLDQLVACIEGICSKSCALSSIEKRDRIHDIVTALSTRRATELSPSNASMTRPLVDPIRKGNAEICYMEGRLLNLLGRTSRQPVLAGTER